jgi:RNA polymerase primary sigma factor
MEASNLGIVAEDWRSDGQLKTVLGRRASIIAGCVSHLLTVPLQIQSKSPLSLRRMALKKEFSIAMDNVRKVTRMGKEEHYSRVREVNEPIPDGVPSGQDVDDLLSTIRTRGLEVLEAEPELPYSALERGLVRESDEIDVNLASVVLDAANDPVRLYLREMGASPLLTREGEVEIAKRIERGQLSSMKALSRSPFVVGHVLDMGEDLKLGLRSIQDTVVFDEEEVTEKILQDHIKETTSPH